MPKKIIYDEEPEDEILEDEEDVEFPEDLPPKRKKLMKKPKRLPTHQKPETPKARFIAFSTSQRIGIADAETNEVIAEGEFAVLQVLANMLERLERIENSIGAMMEG